MRISLVLVFRRISEGTLSQVRRRCGACKNCEISRVFVKPGVALAFYVSSLGPIRSDRSESSVTCPVSNGTCFLNGQRSHWSRSCWCTQVLSPRHVPARQLILLWWSYLTTPSTRVRTFSWVRFSGAAFSQQSGRVLNRSPLRLGTSTGLILHSLAASLSLSHLLRSPGLPFIVPGYLEGSR